MKQALTSTALLQPAFSLKGTSIREERFTEELLKLLKPNRVFRRSISEVAA
ncbi:MAG: hypothetical protein M3410_08540 [Acidobacteriota bacterium]|nr:hypothetical protein [Acidobacteriota bacterium]